MWTAKYLATFLDRVGDDSLFAFWWLTALRGLRRGETCGLRWSQVDLDKGLLVIERNRTTAGYQMLRAHRRRQLAQRDRRAAAGKRWHASGTCSPAPTACKSIR